mmetsp:Transcript_62254/g.148569  ORF Transcript_62254/g.148569 Transcript_62254/m.148569 type:complete len:535 (-) Transcript_62254:165-1769(-)
MEQDKELDCEYQPFEDNLRNIDKYQNGSKMDAAEDGITNGGGETLVRQNSEPLHGTPGIMKASDICKPGGFRRHFVTSAAELHLLPEWINADLDALVSFVQGQGGAPTVGSSPWASPAPAQPAASSSRPEKLTDLQASITIFKAFIAAGILFMPRAMANCGWLPAMLMLLVAGVVSLKGMIQLAECHSLTLSSYAGMGKKAFGTLGYANVSFQLAASQFLFATTGFIFETNTVISVAESFDWPAPPRWAITVALLLLKVPLGFIRKIHGMRHVAMAATICVLTGVGYISYRAFAELAGRGFKVHETARMVNDSGGVLAYVGTSVYAFEGIALLTPVQMAMAKPDHFHGVLCLTVLGIGLLYGGFSLVTYLAWGDTLPDVALNQPLPGSQGFLSALKAAYVIADILNWSIVIFPTFSAVEAAIFPQRSVRIYEAADASRRWRRRWAENTIRTLLAALAALISFYCASLLQVLISFCGVLCCIPLALWIPGSLHWKLVHPAALNERLWNATLVVLGLGVTPFVAWQDLLTVSAKLQ